MNVLVVDSSVAVKWLNQTNEKDLAHADKILELALQRKIEIIAPELVKYEIGNVLLKGKQLTPAESSVAFETAYSLPITFISESEVLARETFLIAYNLGITYYDASFISLAKLYEAALVTDNIKHHGKTKDGKVFSLADY